MQPSYRPEPHPSLAGLDRAARAAAHAQGLPEGAGFELAEAGVVEDGIHVMFFNDRSFYYSGFFAEMRRFLPLAKHTDRSVYTFFLELSL